MKLSLTKSTILNTFYFTFIFILIFYFIQSILNGFPKESWNITEFLINYQGGFVRRGLLGELIFNIYNLTKLSPYLLILFISFLAYIILVWYFIKSFINKGYPLFILPFVFFLGNPIITGFWVRKDAIIILIFISTLYFLSKKSNLYLFLANLVFVTGLLIHESIGFFCFPILFLLLIYQNKLVYRSGNTLINSIIISISQFAPSILTFICVLNFKGSHYISSQIWNSWKPITFPIQSNDDSKIPTAIDGLSWSLEKGLSLTYSTYKNFNDGIYAPMAWIIILLLIYFVLTNTDKLNFKISNYIPNSTFNKSNISNTLIFQFITIIPLFILGWDYGRWVFYWVTSSFAIILLIPENELSNLFPKLISIISTKVNTILDLFLNSSNVLLISVLLGFSRFSWDLTTSINSSSFIIILQFISKVLRNFFEIIIDIL